MERSSPAPDTVADPPLAVAESQWWSGRVTEAIATWERVAQDAADAGDTATAARLCAWVAREYRALGNDVAAAGWLGRAERLADGRPDGWVALARAVTDPTREGRERYAATAVELARGDGDPDLEVVALTRLGLARIGGGDLGDGLARCDEAMALATSGAAARPRTVGEACCDLVLATELTGDVQRLSRWLAVVQDFVDRRGYPAVLGFCATCCAEAEAIQGDFGGAEQQLRAAVVGLHEAGHEARCVPPAAKLAELLVLQGRLEEAEAALEEEDEGAETSLARARLALARGDAAVAAALAARVGRRIAGDVLVRISAQAVLVEAELALDDPGAAAVAVERLGRLVGATDSARARARCEVTRAHVALATGQDGPAAAHFEAALDELAGVQGSIEGAEAHLGLARLAVPTAPDVARAEARAALTAYEAVGAASGVNAAAALLRSLGDRSRVGAKGAGELTQREWEVLQLVAQGLTNAEIGERLFISTKTAGNHVSSILTRLGVRRRAEAARYATLHPTRR
ncbi:LuxR family transcriptional regulator [Nocardioides guangzhouensis]|uniref:LuxR family transcriptional regulator n=1 Tax=Nocardioides guangzhouensis TaxID=2497878 RepID=A0A4Q4Z1B1_9ACTN|nr:helix-turn-helix transcriptional regulator [Nocardioides guangzhouensis]RYP80915.1 LuxR family transcriptional regulator [Nocardioides guangzhouensis]